MRQLQSVHRPLPKVVIACLSSQAPNDAYKYVRFVLLSQYLGVHPSLLVLEFGAYNIGERKFKHQERESCDNRTIVYACWVLGGIM